MNRMRLRVSWLEVGVVLFEMFIMTLFAWSFTVGPPSEAFTNVVTTWGVSNPVSMLVVMASVGAVASLWTLRIRSRFYQRMWYSACAGPLVFYAATIGYYRTFIENGNITVIIIYLAFAAALWLLAATTFRDLKVRK
jgi:hypothetical protein